MSASYAARVDELVDKETASAKESNPYRKTLQAIEDEAKQSLKSGSSDSPSRLLPSPTNLGSQNRSFQEALFVIREWKDSTSRSQNSAEEKITGLGVVYWDLFRKRWGSLGLNAEQVAIMYLRYHTATIDGMAPKKKHLCMFQGLGVPHDIVEASFSYQNDSDIQ